MQITKRKILLEHGISRNPDVSFGLFTASSFYIKVMLCQEADDMGSQFLDLSFVPKDGSTPDYSLLVDKLTEEGLSFPFMTGSAPVITSTAYTPDIRYATSTYADYSADTGTVTGYTDDKLYSVTSYDKNNPFIPNFDLLIDQYLNYKGESIDGRTRIISNSEPRIYTSDANNDATIGTDNQDTGILYKTFSGQTRGVNIENIGLVTIPLTEFKIQGEGWNDTNTTLSALTMDEYLFGITSAPEVQSDVFIERGATTVMEMHLKMSEIESLEHLTEYGNGFFKIRKI